MAEETAKLGLPYMLTNQAQKEVTHNEALDRLDFFSARCIKDIISALPASPIEGDAFIMAASAAENSNAIMHYVNGAWNVYAPFIGLMVLNLADSKDYTYTATGWIINDASGYDDTDLKKRVSDIEAELTGLDELLGGI